jgi:hypothetical protein
MVLGLAVAYVLSSGLAAFRARRDTKLDPVPIAWAIFVFVSQLQFWWGPVFLLTTLERVPGSAFIVQTVLAVALFVAGGLVLPSDSGRYPSDLTTYFETDGRWGVLAYAFYWLLIIPFNNIGIYQVDPAHPANITGAAMIPLAAVAFWFPRGRRIATVIAGVVLLINTLLAAEAVLMLFGLDQ